MSNDETSFMDYWNAVDKAMLKFFGIDTSDAGIEPDLIVSGQEACQTPEDFARWHGDKHGLDYRDDLKVMGGGSAFTTPKMAALNDLCRKAPGVAGRIYRTAGIAALPQEDQSAIFEKVEMFNDFTAGNDPHAERDFGAFEQNGHRVFWKIDCYDTTLTRGSEDPSDPKQTVRVLTIMLASEY
jgi:Protein of unknown function (DUF3768)